MFNLTAKLTKSLSSPITETGKARQNVENWCLRLLLVRGHSDANSIGHHSVERI